MSEEFNPPFTSQPVENMEVGPDSALPDDRIQGRRLALKSMAKNREELLDQYKDKWIAVDQKGSPHQTGDSFDELWTRMSSEERAGLHVQHITDEALPKMGGHAR